MRDNRASAGWRVDQFTTGAPVVEPSSNIDDRALPEREVTREGELVGTPAYSAPEQFRQAATVDIRADIYSFGVVLYEMITGDRPFHGKTIRTFKHQHEHVIPPSPIHRIPDRYRKVAGAIDRIVRRCLEKHPQDRYRSFTELRKALARCLWKLTGERISVPPMIDMNAWDLTSKGISLGVLGHYREELECYQYAIHYKGDYAPATFNQTAALGALGRWTEGLAAAETALEMNPRSIPGRINKGMALFALGRSDEALAVLDEAIHLHPRDPDARYCQAIVLADRGAAAAARTALLRALQLRPTFFEALCALNSRSGPHPDWPGSKNQVYCVRRLEDTSLVQPGNAPKWWRLFRG